MRLRTANNNRRRYDRKALLRERHGMVFGKQRWRGKFRREMQRHVRQMNREQQERLFHAMNDVPFIREMIEDKSIKIVRKPPEASQMPISQDGGPMHAMFLDVNRRYRK